MNLSSFTVQRGCIRELSSLFGFTFDDMRTKTENKHSDKGNSQDATFVNHGIHDSFEIYQHNMSVSIDPNVIGYGEDELTASMRYSSLKHLVLSYCCLDDYSMFPSFSQENAMKNDLGLAPGSSILGQLTGLVTIDLSHNHFVNAKNIFQEMKNCPYLTVVNMAYNKISR
jgi:hypothetical protein